MSLNSEPEVDSALKSKSTEFDMPFKWLNISNHNRVLLALTLWCVFGVFLTFGFIFFWVELIIGIRADKAVNT